MGLFDTLVYVIKSDIRIIKNALDNGQENDDGIVCDIIPEHDFSLMLKDISDDAVQVGEGEIITFEDNDDKETHIDLDF